VFASTGNHAVLRRPVQSATLIDLTHRSVSVLPLGHLACAYLWYVLYAAISTHRFPARLALFPLALGSQFPDLVDKPLAYMNVLTYGRSLAHSLVTFALCSLALWWVTTRFRLWWSVESPVERLRSVTPAAFAVGYLSHLFADSYRFLFAGDLWAARFLLYPVLPVSTAPSDDVAPWIRLLHTYQEIGLHPDLGLISLAVFVFVGVRLRHYWQQTQRN
jgi:hypothetical protein